jgi:hypothetical protein
MTELSKEHARSFFSSQGFAVEDIPTAGDQGEQRADLRVSFDGEEYLVEAKVREPHREWQATIQRAETDGFASTSRSIEPWWLLAKRISEAHAQLVATPASPDAFRVLWVVALHGDADFVISCVEKQLTGVRQLFAFRAEPFTQDLGGAPQAQYCYYFEDNDFERYPEIDAAMLCMREGGQLFVNHFSPNRERFRRSRLHSVVNSAGAVVDAEVRVRNGQALMLDTDFRGPRGGGAQQSYLREKHGLLVSVAMESQFHGVAVIPVASPEGAEEAATSAPECAPGALGEHDRG